MASYVNRIARAIAKEEASRADSLRRSGRLLLVLHDEHGLSWPQVARLTGIAQTTAHRRAQASQLKGESTP